MTSQIIKTTEQCKICEKTIALIGNKWSLRIVNEFNTTGTPLRFNQLLDLLKPISSKTLSSKLKELVDYQILEKTIVSQIPIVATYSLTSKGKDLAGLFESMTKWGKKWNPSLK